MARILPKILSPKLCRSPLLAFSRQLIAIRDSTLARSFLVFHLFHHFSASSSVQICLCVCTSSCCITTHAPMRDRKTTSITPLFVIKNTEFPSIQHFYSKLTWRAPSQMRDTCRMRQSSSKYRNESGAHVRCLRRSTSAFKIFTSSL